MNFIIRFLILAVVTAGILALANEKWARFNSWLMAGYLVVAGIIFIV